MHSNIQSYMAVPNDGCPRETSLHMPAITPRNDGTQTADDWPAYFPGYSDHSWLCSQLERWRVSVDNTRCLDARPCRCQTDCCAYCRTLSHHSKVLPCLLVPVSRLSLASTTCIVYICMPSLADDWLFRQSMGLFMFISDKLLYVYHSFKTHIITQ